MTRQEILNSMSAVKAQKALLVEQNYDLAIAGDVEGAKALIPQIEELNEIFMDLYDKLDEAA